MKRNKIVFCKGVKGAVQGNANPFDQIIMFLLQDSYPISSIAINTVFNLDKFGAGIGVGCGYIHHGIQLGMNLIVSFDDEIVY